MTRHSVRSTARFLRTISRDMSLFYRFLALPVTVNSVSWALEHVVSVYTCALGIGLYGLNSLMSAGLVEFLCWPGRPPLSSPKNYSWRSEWVRRIDFWNRLGRTLSFSVLWYFDSHLSLFDCGLPTSAMGRKRLFSYKPFISLHFLY